MENNSELTSNSTTTFLEFVEVLANVSQSVVLFIVVIGSIVAYREYKNNKEASFIGYFCQIVEYIADEKYGVHENQPLRHWVTGLKSPLSLSDYTKLDQGLKDKLFQMLIDHDRVAFMVINGGSELQKIYKWQDYELQKIYKNLSLVILDYRKNHPSFCIMLANICTRNG